IAIPTAAAELATTTATTAATWRAFFARPSDIDSQITSVQRSTVQSADGLLGFFGSAHRDESKPAWPARRAVHHQVGFENGSVRSERVLEIVLSGIEGKISYKQFIAHVILKLS